MPSYPAYGQGLPTFPGEQPGYGNPAYGLPPEYSGLYAGPGDPLVSPNYSGWWQRGIALLKGAWKPMLILQLIGSVPVIAASVIVALITIKRVDDLNQTTLSGQTPALGDLLGLFVPLIPIVIIGGLLSLIVTLAVYQVLVQHATGQQVSIGAAFGAAARRAPALLGWGIIAGVMVMVGAVLCFLPGLYVITVLAILPAVVMFERGNPIGRSFTLFHNSFGPALGRIATIFGLYLGAGIVERIIGSIIGVSSGYSGTTATVSAGAEIASSVISGVISMALGLLTAPLFLCAYADMRSRHEPFSTAYLLPQQPTI